ncbi:hypothetical protein IG631_16822 [Alternaria alternata]|nr:hypothetical protein IG631_16822 [Alternaria alternata]
MQTRLIKISESNISRTSTPRNIPDIYFAVLVKPCSRLARSCDRISPGNLQRATYAPGCSESTVGNALALEFAKRGWTVYATARSTTKMANLEGNPNIKPLALDVTDGKSVFAARDKITFEQGGKLDCLYHNAGVRSISMAIDYDTEEQRKMAAGEEQPYIRSDDVRMFEGNVIGVMALTRAFSKLLIAAKGTVAVTGSGSSRVQVPTSATYNATKAAVEMYAKTLRLEMQPFGCHVVYVMTGAVATPMYYAQDITFADDSPYNPIADKIVAGWKSEPENVPQPAEDYAQFVVERVIKMSPPREVWCGTGIGALWWVEKLGLTWLLDVVYSRRHGLNTTLS